MDIQKIPFAEWLENFIRQMSELKPKWIGVTALDEQDNCYTSYTCNDNYCIMEAIKAMFYDSMTNFIRLNSEEIAEILMPQINGMLGGDDSDDEQREA